jgi:hypothetical protein
LPNYYIGGLRGHFDRAAVAYAQSPTGLEQAELAGLSPQLRAAELIYLRRTQLVSRGSSQI